MALIVVLDAGGKGTGNYKQVGAGKVPFSQINPIPNFPANSTIANSVPATTMAEMVQYVIFPQVGKKTG